MPDSFSRLVSMPGPEIHRKTAKHERNCDNKALLHNRKIGVELLLEARDNRWQEETDGIQAVDDAEIDERQRPDASLSKGLLDGYVGASRGVR